MTLYEKSSSLFNLTCKDLASPLYEYTELLQNLLIWTGTSLNLMKPVFIAFDDRLKTIYPADTLFAISVFEVSEERPATRRSIRIQHLTGNTVRPLVFQELPPIKRPPRNRKVSVFQPTETVLEPRESKISQQLSQKRDQSPVNYPALSQVSRTRTQVGVFTEI